MCFSTTSIRDSWVSLVTWSAQRSGGRPVGRRHDEGGLEVKLTMVWVPGRVAVVVPLKEICK